MNDRVHDATLDEEGLTRPLWYQAARVAAMLAQCLREGAGPGQAALLAFLDDQWRLAGQHATGAAAGVRPFARLCAALRLGPQERLLLLLTGMPEEHEGYGAVFAALHPKGEPYPTVSLFARLAGHGPTRLQAWQLVAGSALFAHRLIIWTDDAPLPERGLRLTEHLWPALAGVPLWPPGCAPLPGDALPFDDGWFDSVRPTLQRLAAVPQSLLWLHGEGAALRAGELAARLGNVGCFDIDGWSGATLDGVLAHCLARGTLALLRVPRGLSAEQAACVERHPAPLVLAGAAGPALPTLRRPLLPLAAPPLARAAQPRLWRDAVPQLAPHAEALAARFALDPQTLARVRADLEAGFAPDAPVSLDAGVAALQARLPDLAGPALRRRTPRLGWDDLILPAGPRRQLADVAARLRTQWRVLDQWGFDGGDAGRRGVRLLFCGLPGTGKTLAAEVLAHELAVSLLVVDLARLISKWIGETEKNLEAVFDEAQSARAVLFFDEADALFTRRTDVSDAHDRYANVETAYLLTRLERFDGVAVLATNLKQQLDRAFLRRFEAIVDFPEPGQAERAAIWRRHLPGAAPLAPDVDFDALAALYPMSGAMIRNALLAAAYYAAAEESPIGQAQLCRAIVLEFEKSGRPCPQ
ncbi:ATP-binding protein [Chitiniphilus purpureus]|uniref:ATP-binding protein n=1 Tax=Chitiniphilus purpureus TaxID=2981137 RepID=A0ABY6DLV9_9NEIS|nr:ATP-binding protein [Chitiniphilus sp. CD1]UXY14678.1 ATP-binding protein [Chitiniphilus sp. CD1]